MALTAGTRLGPYEILAPLGAGGMGEVYRARDTRLDRTVAIKVLPERLSASPELKQRFEREARAVSALSHPNICALHDVGEQDGMAYLVMEHLEGGTPEVEHMMKIEVRQERADSISYEPRRLPMVSGMADGNISCAPGSGKGSPSTSDGFSKLCCTNCRGALWSQSQEDPGGSASAWARSTPDQGSVLRRARSSPTPRPGRRSPAKRPARFPESRRG